MLVSHFLLAATCVFQVSFAIPSPKPRADYSELFALKVTGDRTHKLGKEYVHHAYLTVDIDSKYDQKYIKAGNWHSIFLKISRKDAILDEPDKKFYFKYIGDKKKKRLCYANKGQQYPEDLCAAITCGSDWHRCQTNANLMGFAALSGIKSHEEGFIDDTHPKYYRRYLEDWQEDSDHFLRPWGIAHYVAVWEKDSNKFKDMDYPYLLKWYDRDMGASVSIQRVY